MSNNELIDKIAVWISPNSYYQENKEYAGRNFVYTDRLYSMLTLLKTKE